ncbi:MAG: CDP-alcohol phosphatidyltransferase family protein, partial [Taibaiella sp.]|nr:CDP-alcohol phosphatidyltransferase family protein [Taibaiella sp.]
DFIQQQLVLIIVLLALLVIQTVMALVRYGKISSFHTYLAKIAALLQGSFLILLFFLPEPPLTLFYIASAVTIIEILEEMAMVIILPEWKANIHGLYWALKDRKKEH